MAFVYWEQQEGDALCGVHCLNALLQGPFFTEVDLSRIALDLDQRERQLMLAQGPQSADFLRFAANDSSNVAMSGNYSLQVLEFALQRMGLKMSRTSADQNRKAIDTARIGFVFNIEEHWFCYRHLHGTWYNLDSLSRNGPESLSEFYVDAVVSGSVLRDQGYNIFQVVGAFPSYPSMPTESERRLHQHLIPRLVIEAHQEQRTQQKRKNNRKNNLAPAQSEDQIQKAINASLNQNNQSTKPSSSHPSSPIKQLPLAPSFVLFSTQSSESLMESLSARFTEQQSPENGLGVRFRDYFGESFLRHFSWEDSIETLYEFAWFRIESHNRKGSPAIGVKAEAFVLRFTDEINGGSLTDLIMPLLMFSDYPRIDLSVQLAKAL